jgi:hypothetical protein
MAFFFCFRLAYNLTSFMAATTCRTSTDHTWDVYKPPRNDKGTAVSLVWTRALRQECSHCHVLSWVCQVPGCDSQQNVIKGKFHTDNVSKHLKPHDIALGKEAQEMKALYRQQRDDEEQRHQHQQQQQQQQQKQHHHHQQQQHNNNNVCMWTRESIWLSFSRGLRLNRKFDAILWSTAGNPFSIGRQDTRRIRCK